VKLDAHVHTALSANASDRLVRKILKESYSSPRKVYGRAKANGMDLVAITDHDTIDGALEIAHHPDVIIGCEVTAVFAGDGVRVHLGVLDITEKQHSEIQKLRRDVRELMPYLRQQRIFTILNHVASRVTGRISANHILALTPWVDGIETLNGTSLPSQNRTATALAEAYGKVRIAGSDSHTLSRIGRNYLEVDASDRTQFMNALRNGTALVRGDHRNYLTLSSDIVRIAAGFCKDGICKFVSNPLNARHQVQALACLLGLPLTALSLAGAIVYMLMEERFNRSLLFDLVAKPATCASDWWEANEGSNPWIIRTPQPYSGNNSTA
jgi:predicted metal-dependent phosphoesterase TrpH